MIKSIGTAARRELERELGTRVHLDLSVRVRRSWRGDDALLDRLGHHVAKIRAWSSSSVTAIGRRSRRRSRSRAAAGAGRRRAGEAGIGKTALVAALRRDARGACCGARATR